MLTLRALINPCMDLSELPKESARPSGARLPRPAQFDESRAGQITALALYMRK